MKGDAAVIHVCEALASGILRVVPALADETVALARCAHTIACSLAEGSVAARLSRGRGVSVVQNGVDGELAEAAVAHEGFVVASVGRAAYQRRPDLFAQMRTLLGEDGDTAFHWFGDGPDREVLVGAGVSVSGWL